MVYDQLYEVFVIIVSLQLKSATHESSCAMTLNCIASNFTSCFIASSTPDLNHCKCYTDSNTLLYASDEIIIRSISYLDYYSDSSPVSIGAM